MIEKGDLESEIEECLSEIAPRLGRDMPYFIPTSELHFDPISVGVALAALMVAAYIRGFLKEAENQAESAGSDTFIWLRRNIGKLFSREDHSSKDDGAQELHNLTSEAVTKVAKMSEEEVTQAHDSMERCLADELQIAWSIPHNRAVKISVIVHDQVTLLIRHSAD